MISFGTPLPFQASGLNWMPIPDNSGGQAQGPGSLSFRDIVIERLMSQLSASPASSVPRSVETDFSPEASPRLARLEWRISMAAAGAPEAVEELRSEILSLVSDLKAAWSSRAEIPARNRIEAEGLAEFKADPFLGGAGAETDPPVEPPASGVMPVRVQGGNDPAEGAPVLGRVRTRTEFEGPTETDETSPSVVPVRFRNEIEAGEPGEISAADPSEPPVGPAQAGFAASVFGGQAVSPPSIPVPEALGMLERAVLGADRFELAQIAAAVSRSFSPDAEGEPGTAIRGDQAGARIVRVAGQEAGPDAESGPAVVTGRANAEDSPVRARVRAENRLAVGVSDMETVEVPDSDGAVPVRHAAARSGGPRHASQSPVLEGEAGFRLASAGTVVENRAPVAPVGESSAEAAPPVRVEAEGPAEGLPAVSAGDGIRVHARTRLETQAGTPQDPPVPSVEVPRRAAAEAPFAALADEPAESLPLREAARTVTAERQVQFETAGIPVRSAARESLPEEPALLFAGGFEEEQGEFMNVVTRRTGEAPIDPLRAENRLTARFGSAPEAPAGEAAEAPGRIPVAEAIRTRLTETLRENSEIPAAVAVRTEARAASILESAPVPPPVRAVLERVSEALAGSGEGELKELEIRVDTAELGRVRVRFEVENSGNIRVEMTVSSQQAAASLRDGLPYLRQMIEMQRLSVEVAQIAVGPAADFGNGGQAHQKMRWFDFEPGIAGVGRQEEPDVAGIVRAGFTRRLSMVDVLA